MHLASGGQWQLDRLVREPARHARVIDAHLGIVDRRRHLGQTTQVPARAVGAAVDHMAHQIEHVLVGAAEPVLQRHEIGAHILRGARHKAQHLRNAAQHLHLRGAAGGGLALVAAQLLEQRHRPAGRLAHVEVTEPRELDDLGRRGHADHRVAMLAARLQRRQDRQEMVFQKQHAGDDDVGLRDVGLAAGNGGVVAGVLGRRMQRELQARHLTQQCGLGAGRGAGEVGVHRHDDHADRRGVGFEPGVSGRNGLLRHRGSRR